jgi:hypothetical protein
VLTIDGSKFVDLDGFAREFSALLTDWTWTGNLDAFNDILGGGFGTPAEGFVLRWIHSDQSRKALGWPETISFHVRKLEHGHPENHDYIQNDLDSARQHIGPTLFDLIIEIVRNHGPGGSAPEDAIELQLL